MDPADEQRRRGGCRLRDLRPEGRGHRVGKLTTKASLSSRPAAPLPALASCPEGRPNLSDARHTPLPRCPRNLRCMVPRSVSRAAQRTLWPVALWDFKGEAVAAAHADDEEVLARKLLCGAEVVRMEDAAGEALDAVKLGHIR